MPQVRPEHYRTDEYNSVERFCSYAHQLKLITGLNVKSILEVGPGAFLVSDALKRRGYEVTTCDFDPELGADITADVRSLPFPDGAFDLVMACQVLEHLPFNNFTTSLHELQRVSNKYVIISLPCSGLGWNIITRFPFIQTLFNRRLIEASVWIPLPFRGFSLTQQHYWELDAFRTPKRAVRKHLSTNLKIMSETRPNLAKYQYFFTAEKPA
jgi:ubiquinone/menaquinone biosynthesis C-methylase UbiE